MIGALEGNTVVDITQGLCGPYASLLLAEAGAEVIKVEPLGGDYAREFGPPFVGGASATFQALNRNKRCIALDIQNPRGAETLRRLVERSNVFLEDLGPGVAEGLGLGYAGMERSNPGLVYASITAFGDKGPFRDLPGSELVVQAMSEFWGSLGAIDEQPERLGADVANMNTAVFAFNSVLAAVYHRELTAQGQRVSVSMYGTLMHMRGILWIARHDPDDWSGQHQEGALQPRDHGYQASDLSVYFSLRRGDEEAYVRFLTDLGMTEVLGDPRFDNGGRDAVGRGRYASELKPVWEEAFKNRSAAEVVDLVKRYDGDAVELNDYQGLMAHPQVEALGIVREPANANGLRSLEPSWKISGLDPVQATPSPRLGEHTSEILTEVNHSEQEIQQLRDTGVVL